MIPDYRRNLYDQQEPPFGAAVADAFPDADFDVAAAARCPALDEWTACVFHSMRVLEHGLRHVAGVLNVPMAATIEYENWGNIIDQIEKAIRSIEQQPRGAEKSARSQFYSEAASQFRYFKNAWRNHVSHARAKYDEREAREVWTHVRQFMQQLAEAEEQDGRS